MAVFVPPRPIETPADGTAVPIFKALVPALLIEFAIKLPKYPAVYKEELDPIVLVKVTVGITLPVMVVLVPNVTRDIVPPISKFMENILAYLSLLVPILPVSFADGNIAIEAYVVIS
jgi:hypothetical protein